MRLRRPTQRRRARRNDAHKRRGVDFAPYRCCPEEGQICTIRCPLPAGMATREIAEAIAAAVRESQHSVDAVGIADGAADAPFGTYARPSAKTR